MLRVEGKVSNRLKQKLDELEIDLIFKKMDRRGFYWPDMSSIIVNEDLLYSNDVNFAIAHELSHALEKHYEISALYSSSFSSRSKIEAEANITAIKILLEVYLEENEIDFKQLNSLKFMEYYGISSSLYSCIEETILSYAI